MNAANLDWNVTTIFVPEKSEATIHADVARTEGASSFVAAVVRQITR
jgi:hypothetical protein